MISDRANQIDTSGIRKVFDLAQKMKNPINLSIGQPDFDVPDIVKEAAKLAIDEGVNRYTPSVGLPELIEILKLENNILGDTSNCLMTTSGVSGGILLSLMALVNPGEHVLAADPFFVMYRDLPRLIEAKVNLINTYPDFRLTAKAVEESLTKETKILFLNSPSNPTGCILTKKELSEIADVLKNSGVYVVSDEIYDVFDYEGKFCSFSTLYDKTITLRGFSKSLGMTGWRMGYAYGPKEVIDAMIKIQQYTFVCAPSFAQKACLKAFEVDFKETCDQYRKKRDYVFENLSNKYQFKKSDGAFYSFIKHPRLNGDELVEKALEKEVLIIPGSVFSQENSHFRLSFAAPMETLIEGVNRLLDID